MADRDDEEDDKDKDEDKKPGPNDTAHPNPDRYEECGICDNPYKLRGAKCSRCGEEMQPVREEEETQPVREEEETQPVREEAPQADSASDHKDQADGT